MTRGISRRVRKRQGGFTLIELLVVILIIGILAAIAVPQYFKVVEKGKVSESLTTFDAIRGAQERFLAATGNYCTTAAFACAGWDMPIPTLKYFEAPRVSAGVGVPSWKATMQRLGSPAVYGTYTITYTVEPSVPPAITCSQAACATDLMPQ